METFTFLKSEDVKSGLEYQDEPMDVNETFTDGYVEEGEINSSDDEKKASVKLLSSASNIFTSKYDKNEAGRIFSTPNALDKDDVQKKLERAKRFSLPILAMDPEEIHKEKLSNLYRDLGIDKENERHYRFNTIHMRGTENMSTDDVLQYFATYAPSHVEWINDVSCNIVWMDDVSAARALLNTSKRIKNLDKVHLNADPFEKDFRSDPANEESSDDSAVDAREIATAIPPGFWRIGVPCNKSSCLLLRYATRSDKKQRNAEKNSEYYKKYGNPHYGNIPGLISNSFRSGVKNFRFKASESIGNDQDKHNPWEELAYEWGRRDKEEKKDEKFNENNIYRRTQISDLRISLTNKKKQAKRLRTDSLRHSDKESWESKSKIPRMKMYADDEEKRLEKKIEKQSLINKFKRQPEEDLRSKINKKKAKPRFKFTSDKKAASETSDNEDEYEDGDSGDWALEHYHDLRESLVQNKKHEQHRHNPRTYESDSEDDNIDDEIYKKDFNQRSPLQIEIENDEYYKFNKS